MVRSIWILFGSAIILSACSSEKDKSDQKRFEAFVVQHKLGDTDYWLERQSNITGNWDKIALFFGMIGDDQVCQQAVDSLAMSYPNEMLRCVPAQTP